MFANNLKKLRESKQISQEELATVLGVRQQTVGKWEKKISVPRQPMLEKIATFFNVSTDYLLGRTDDPTPPTETKPEPHVDDPASVKLSPEEIERALAMRNASPEIMRIIDSALSLSREQQQDSKKESHG